MSGAPAPEIRAMASLEAIDRTVFEPGPLERPGVQPQLSNISATGTTLTDTSLSG
jgi:hypothetical protein